MQHLTRRTFANLSMAGAATLAFPRGLSAAQCLSDRSQAPLPSRLAVGCASRHNFKLFRQNSKVLGLAGVVNVTFAGGAFGPSTLFVFPWVKPAGQRGPLPASRPVIPVGAYSTRPADFIPNGNLPTDEYVCRFVLDQPTRHFIGFSVDVPHKEPTTNAWTSDVPRLSDGKGISVDWTSSNLNNPWFGGSRFVPDAEACNGGRWRALVLAALYEASAGAAC